MTDASTLEEYKNQLKDVEELLRESPDDPEFLGLKKDLMELIEISESSALSSGINQGDDKLEDDPVSQTVPGEPSSIRTATADTTPATKQTAYHTVDLSLNTETTANIVDVASLHTHVPKVKDKEFQVPAHLIVKDTDSEAVQKRKKRKIKQLKDKHRLEHRNWVAEKKKGDWMNFQKKKKIKNNSSMFRTDPQEDTKVGVVSAAKRR